MPSETPPKVSASLLNPHIRSWRTLPQARVMTQFEVIFLDVGVGDCTLIALPNGEYMLVDVYRCPEQGTVDVFKVLRDVLPQGADGKQLLHYLVITHAHDDHIWGIGDLADEFEIGELWVPQYGTKKEALGQLRGVREGCRRPAR